MAVKDILNPKMLLPDMGDYYLECLDHEFYRSVAEKLHKDTANSKKHSPVALASFYTETPPNLGYDEQYKTYSIDIKLPSDRTMDGEQMGNMVIVDGDTIILSTTAMNGGDAETKKYIDGISDGQKAALQQAGLGEWGNQNAIGGVVALRFACIDTMEVPHFSKIGKAGVLATEQKTYAEAAKDPDYVVSKWHSFIETGGVYNIPTTQDAAGKEENPKLDFVKIGGKYHQSFNKDGYCYALLTSDATSTSAEVVADAGKARDTVVDMVSKATDMRILVDGSIVSKTSLSSGYTTPTRVQPLAQDSLSLLKQMWESVSGNTVPLMSTTFQMAGLDVYGRAISAVYVKVDGTWINLNKYVIANTEHTNVNQTAHSTDNTARNNFYSRALDADSYELRNKIYADDVFNVSAKFDDRPEVQAKIFGALGKDFNTVGKLKDWTLTIGDVTLFVPPTSIRCVNQTKTTRMPLIRARGSMAKSSHKSQRMIQMDLYFNGEYGINGYPLEADLPNGKKTTYYMNGLRALIAQFKVAPFLPIDNNYINQVLNVDAVFLSQISISSVPGFPQLYRASLTLGQFEYRVYMPEIPLDQDDVYGERNYFSKQINYPLFRWYYQRLIQNGQDLKDVDFLSDEYLNATIGNHTCLVPMAFQDSSMRFYIPNREQLNKMKQVKLSRLMSPTTPMDLTQNQLDASKDIKQVYDVARKSYENNDGNVHDLNVYLQSDTAKGYALVYNSGTHALSVAQILTDGENVSFQTDDKCQEIYKTVHEKLISSADDYVNKFRQLKNKDGADICTNVTRLTPTITSFDNGSRYAYTVPITVTFGNLNISDDELKTLKTYTTQAQGALEGQSNSETYSQDEIFAGRTITVPISIPLKLQSSGEYYAPLGAKGLEATSGLGPEADFISEIATIADQQSVNGQAEANSLKANMDFSQTGSIQWELFYTKDDFRLEAIQVGMANTYSQTTLQQLDGFAPQFMGGTDTQIHLSIKTTSPKVAAAMNSLTTIAAQYAREYRLVLPSWPLKLESEVTKLMGITDVTVEQVQVNTVPNFPGLYDIQISAISVDRTLRNRESIRKAAELPNFSDISIKGKHGTRTMTYDTINKMLSNAELYPDLELPTLKEFDEAGFRFVRYASNPDRVYPDPDFYFTYSYALVSQTIREAVLNGINSAVMNATVTDSDGECMVGNMASKGLGTFSATFDRSRVQLALNDSTLDPDTRNAARTISDFMVSSENTFGKIWNIASNIKVAMCEENMASSLSDYTKLKEKAIRTLQTEAEEKAKEQGSDTIEEPTEEQIKARMQELKDTERDYITAKMSAESADKAVNGEANSILATVTPPKTQMLTNGSTSLKTKSTKVGEDDSKEKSDDNKKSDDKESDDKKSENKEEQKEDKDQSSKETDKQENAESTDKAIAATQAKNKQMEEEMKKNPQAKKDDRVNEADRSATPYAIAQWKEHCDEAIKSIDNILNAPVVEGVINTTPFKHLGMETGSSQKEKGGVAGGGGNVDVSAIDKNIKAFVDAAFSAMSAEEEYETDENRHWKPTDLRSSYWGILLNDDGSTTQIDAQTKLDEYVSQHSDDYSPEDYEGYGFDVLGYDTDGGEALAQAQSYAKYLGQAKDWMLDNIAERAVAFGPFRLKMYSAQELRDLFEDDDAVTDSATAQNGLYMLDPYYRYATIDAIKEYKRKVCSDKDFARVAFWRICLLWMKKILMWNVLPSFAFDLYRDKLKSEDFVLKVLNSISEARNSSRTTELLNKMKKAEEVQKEKDKAAEEAANGDDKTDAQKKNDSKAAAESAKQAAEQAKTTYEEAKKALEQLKASETKNNQAVAKEYQKFFKENSDATDLGKLYLIVLTTILGGHPDFVDRLKNRKYEELNAMSQSVISGGSTNSTNSDMNLKIRKFTKALVGYGVIKSNELGKGDDQSFSEMMNKTFLRRIQLAASDDPAVYLVHSWYDMITKDCRGRMARAFPTFYMIFIDEGRRIGKWKLHDNFYNTNAIAEVTIARSRNIAADTAEVTMSNFYQTFTTDDEDIYHNYTTNWTDVATSIFNPDAYAKREEERRSATLPVERIHLKAGTRIQIRIGYGADASKLPVSFNGIIAEMPTAGDIVHFVAQGDGIELAKPILLDRKAHEIKHLDEWFDGNSKRNGATPKSILDGLLTTHGGPVNRSTHENYSGTVLEMAVDKVGTAINPLGIYHFGDIDFTYVTGEPEPTQNIFEITNPNIGEDEIESAADRKQGIKEESEGGSIAEGAMGGATVGATVGSFIPLVGTAVGAAVGAVAGGAIAATNSSSNPDYPLLEFDLFGKSVWDVMHIVKGAEPDYIASIAPFGFRSTVFFGRPHDYYAYEYQKIDGAWYEKRKPFQQYHIISSVTDIMANQMSPSSKAIKTCAVGLYSVQGSFGTTSSKKTDPIWVDKNIFPEYQQTMFFDTKLYGASARPLGAISDIKNFIFSSISNDFLDRCFDGTGSVRNHHAMATKMTKNALKESIWNMYQGPVIILGDPTIKPYDKVHMNDMFQNITGAFQVRDVVETFSVSEGYTTAIYPDLIATTKEGAIDEIRSQTALEMAGQVAAGAFAAITYMTTAAVARWAYSKTLTAMANSAAGRGATSMAQTLSQWAQKATEGGTKASKAVARLQSLGTSFGKVGQRVSELFSSVGNSTAGKLLGRLGIPVTVGFFAIGGLKDNLTTAWDNRRALTLFPMKHFGRVYVAGIDGHTGLCYGAPNYNGEGLFGQLFVEGTQKFKNGAPWLFKAVNALWKDGPFAQADSAYRAKLIESKGGIASEEGFSQKAVEAVNGSTAELFQSAKVNPMVPRMSINDRNDRQKIWQAYSILPQEPGMSLTEERICKHPNWQNMVPVFELEGLKQFIDMGFFRIISRGKGFDSSVSDQIKCIYLTKPGEPSTYVAVNAFVKEKNGITTYDIPYLNKHATSILQQIVQISYECMLGTEQTRDVYRWYQQNAGSYLVLTSALVAGSTVGVSASGFAFEIQASSDIAGRALNDAISRLEAEFKKNHEKNEKFQENIFESKTEARKAKIVVRPPEVEA